MNIDVIKLLNESEKKQVSVYILLKREINYRKIKEYEKGCFYCKFAGKIKFPSADKERIQCEIIGYCNDGNADIDEKHICRCFKQTYNKLS